MKFIFTRKKVMAWFIGSLLVLSTIPFVTKAVRTDVSRDFPVYNNHGQPDLTVDPKRFVSQMQIMDRFFDASSCELAEGSVGGTGYRRLLRFDTVLMNSGDGDLVGLHIGIVSINEARAPEVKEHAKHHQQRGNLLDFCPGRRFGR